MYLKCDVLFLTYLFENFKKNSLKYYGLCQSHYLSAPTLRWDAMIKMTKVVLEFIPDPTMCMFFGKGTRGGISYIFNRCSKASNKHLKSYNSKQESKDIIYLDTHNLYGYAMSTFLPTSGFKWIYPKEFGLNR